MLPYTNIIENHPRVIAQVASIHLHTMILHVRIAFDSVNFCSVIEMESEREDNLQFALTVIVGTIAYNRLSRLYIMHTDRLQIG